MSSIEESFKILAESNLALAKAQTYYADTINKFGLKINEANGEAGSKTPDKSTEKEKPATETAAQKKAREKAASAAKAKDDDGFGDSAAGEKAEEALTADDVKAKLFEVKDANGGDKTPAIEIIEKYGYKAIPEVKAKDYRNVVNDCNEWLEENT